MLENNKRPNVIVTTLLPWGRSKPLAWDVTVPDTFAESDISDTVSTPGAAANKATQHKLDKYAKLLDTHVCYPVAVGTAGSWNSMAIVLMQEIGRHITIVTQDDRETTFLFQRLSIDLQRGKAVTFSNTMLTD